MKHLVADDVARASALAASRIADLSRDAIDARGMFSVALTAAPELEPVYRALRARKDVDWKRWEVFFAEERAVSTESPDSAFGFVTEHLLSKVPVREAKVRPMFSLGLDVATAAVEYIDPMVALLGDPPVFDLVLFTVGRNAEVLGLHSMCPALTSEAPVEAVADAPMAPEGDRITLTPYALRAARELMVVAFGAKGARPLRMVLEDADDRLRVPGQVIRDAGGEVTLVVDEPLAKLLDLA
ncbi:MAG: 6-phosphogluconolactonase [Polyangiales bacterium]